MKNNNKKFIVLLFLIVNFNFTAAQQVITSSKENEPIEINADSGIEWHKNEKKYVAIGNAKAISGGLSLESDKIEAFYDESDDSSMDIKKVIAKKNVIISDKKMMIKGGKFAEYDVKKDYFIPIFINYCQLC